MSSYLGNAILREEERRRVGMAAKEERGETDGIGKRYRRVGTGPQLGGLPWSVLQQGGGTTTEHPRFSAGFVEGLGAGLLLFDGADSKKLYKSPLDRLNSYLRSVGLSLCYDSLA